MTHLCNFIRTFFLKAYVFLLRLNWRHAAFFSLSLTVPLFYRVTGTVELPALTITGTQQLLGCTGSHWSTYTSTSTFFHLGTLHRLRKQPFLISPSPRRLLSFSVLPGTASQLFFGAHTQLQVYTFVHENTHAQSTTETFSQALMNKCGS